MIDEFVRRVHAMSICLREGREAVVEVCRAGLQPGAPGHVRGLGVTLRTTLFGCLGLVGRCSMLSSNPHGMLHVLAASCRFVILYLLEPDNEGNFMPYRLPH